MLLLPSGRGERERERERERVDLVLWAAAVREGERKEEERGKEEDTQEDDVEEKKWNCGERGGRRKRRTIVETSSGCRKEWKQKDVGGRY